MYFARLFTVYVCQSNSYLHLLCPTNNMPSVIDEKLSTTIISVVVAYRYKYSNNERTCKCRNITLVCMENHYSWKLNDGIDR